MSTGAAPPAGEDVSRGGLLEVIQRHWGFTTLRPLQERAMQAVLAGRDSLLVLPTGGGKSLCYQAPAVLRQQVTVVISPLISLMKDQVDGLVACGVPAVQLNSAQSNEEQRQGEQAVLEGQARLVFASPERMATGSFRGFLQRVGVRTFAIDEAHCISHWGHDFRPEYRQLRRLKDQFPDSSVHAFTATATETVRADVVEQLGLRDPDVMVGSFDRPNLTYRVVPRHDVVQQSLEVVRRHSGEAGIVYCLRRRDVDELTGVLRGRGVNAVPYHAGMRPDERKRTHDLFSDEQCDVVVATVAFGMGIDRSNIRYVLHAGMPKSIEHYQQETGRAGRDGLEAECVLLYSAGDAMTWKKLVRKSADESETPVDPEFLQAAFRHIADMEAYCRPVRCRHRTLVEYFGQDYAPDNCAACDLCLGDAEQVPDAQTIAKKVLSCVYRVQQGFGAAYVTAVLRGARSAQIRERGHDRLSTYGLLAGHSVQELRDFIHQLIGQGVLVQAGDEYPILQLNAASWDVMNDRRSVRLSRIPVTTGSERPDSGAAALRAPRSDAASWEGVDQELFEALRQVRLRLAGERGVPPYLIFGDATLRDLARVRPSTRERMRLVYGVGEVKLRDFGEALLAEISRHCAATGLPQDCPPATPVRDAPREGPRPLSPGATQARDLYRRGASIEEVASQLGRARSIVVEYLAGYIREERPASLAPWVSDEQYHKVAATIARVGHGPLKPIFLALGETVPYDVIRLVAVHCAGGTK